MPGFGPGGGRLANALLERDDAPSTKTAAPKAKVRDWWRDHAKPDPRHNTAVLPPGHLELGTYLVSRDGLSCITCHPVNGYKLPGTDDPTTRASDMGLIGTHIRKDYFARLLRDPLRVFPGTKMPQVFDSDGTMPVPGLTELPPELIVEALWSYITLGANAPKPVSQESAKTAPPIPAPSPSAASPTSATNNSAGRSPSASPPARFSSTPIGSARPPCGSAAF